MKHIRNFCIIAHIDHGKSTLADRLIEYCGGLSKREMQAQVLDGLELERERGITIKAQAVTLYYPAKDGIRYQLNIIDTPGHVDFSYEVSRSLAACEGALLVVDAAQGVEAQTVAVCYTAINQNLTLLPVLNKMDLPQADAEKACNEIEDIIGIPADNAVHVSAKSGMGIEELLEAIIKYIPAPVGDKDAPLQALITDSWFDNYLGVVSLVRIVHGTLEVNDMISVMSTGKKHQVIELGSFSPRKTSIPILNCGEVGYIIAGIKHIEGAPVGDTVTHFKSPAQEALPGFESAKPLVFAGLFPTAQDQYHLFKDALSKLRLNDSALSYESEQSEAMGHGFRCGFLGLLHMEIVQERLEREYNIDLITTAPNVAYEIVLKSGEVLLVDRPSRLPETNLIQEMREPMALANILTPENFLGDIITLCIEKRGMQHRIQYTGKQIAVSYWLPLSEIVMDFYDRLKSVSRGYASLDYHFDHFAPAPLVKMDMLINGESVDALSIIMHKDRALPLGRALAKKLKELIPRQMFQIAIQASIGSNVIARETISAMRKDVLAKCYGGDISRKQKLLKKQAAGKKRMKNIGRVQVPQSAFLAVLNISDKDRSS